MIRVSGTGQYCLLDRTAPYDGGHADGEGVLNFIVSSTLSIANLGSPTWKSYGLTLIHKIS